MFEYTYQNMMLSQTIDPLVSVLMDYNPPRVLSKHSMTDLLMKRKPLLKTKRKHYYELM